MKSSQRWNTKLQDQQIFQLKPRSHLDEHLWSRSQTRNLGWYAVWAHGFPVPGEFEGEFLLPHALDSVVDDQGSITAGFASFVKVPWVQFFSKYSQGSFSSFSDFLEALFVLFKKKQETTDEDSPWWTFKLCYVFIAYKLNNRPSQKQSHLAKVFIIIN